MLCRPASSQRFFGQLKIRNFGQDLSGLPGKGSSPEFICPPIEEDTGWPGPDGEVMLLG